jgi:hypothetical protein
VIGVIAAALGLVATAASADEGGTEHTVTTTEHQHGTFTDPGAFNPCTGAQGVALFDGSYVFHVTFFPAEDEIRATLTETGKITVTWSGVTYTGHATARGQVNLREINSNATSTLSIRVFAPDGSGVVGHALSHFTLNANGEITASFDGLRFTCS